MNPNINKEEEDDDIYSSAISESNRLLFPPPPIPTVAPLPPPPPFRQQQQQSHALQPLPPTTTTTATTTTTTSTAIPPLEEPPKKVLWSRTSSSSSKIPVVTAGRQTQIPILIVATEAAHRLAWKNQLRISDLFQGLAKTISSSSSSSDPTTNTSTTTTTNNNILPFRSVSNHKPLSVSLEELELQFFEDKDDMDRINDEHAAQILQRVAQLQPSDGNLEQELQILEDKIDHLLSSELHSSEPSHYHSPKNTPTNSTITTSTTISSSLDGMERHEQMIRNQEQVTKDAYQLTSPLHIPWLTRFRQALDETTHHGTHEQFACPAVIVTVATTHEIEDNVVEILRALQSPHYLPTPFRNGMYDPNSIRREVLILHDNVEAAARNFIWDENRLRQELQRSFPNSTASAVLRINSLDPETAAIQAQEETTDVWNGGGQLGNCLTVADRARIRKYIAQLITYAVLPALEKRIADLNAIVSDRKKGVRNVLKSFWGGGRTSKKEDEETTTTSTSLSIHAYNTTGGGGIDNSRGGNPTEDEVKYRYDTIECQVRLLADTLFLMKDYEAAYSMYRLVKDDFKQDKSWMHYASNQEMTALSLYMLDPYGRSKEIFSAIENALLSYSRVVEEFSMTPQWGEKPGRVMVAPLATRLATRLCLVLTATRSICANRHLEVADLLASASSHETALGAAVLLEQSAAQYFQAEMYRKYAFHMLMSGHMFRTAEQEAHAFRCFTSALYIYREDKWEELHNHLRSALAAQLFSMGRMSIALQLYCKLVGSSEGGRVSIKSQQKFVTNLLEICNDHKKAALAAADRMAAPAHLSGSQRDAVRKKRLDRIVQVIRYTKSASRVLELPNVDLPRIDDSTVSVLAEDAAHHRQDSVAGFGEADIGSEEVWDDLTLKTIAELKASQTTHRSIVYSKILRKIEDPDIRRMIALIDKEKIYRSMQERNKKSSTYIDNARVRAVMEPIAVEFVISNPLGIPVDLCDLQLVATMRADGGNRVCTNEDAIHIRPLATSNEKQIWTFQSSDVEFEVPHFCRVSSTSRKDDYDKESWKSAEDLGPFFVVTKSNITLEPERSRNISASICPLVMGDLEVIGVRCRIFDDVWVFHKFDIKGPLLQNTRANRANRVRGESFLLKSKVEQGMPCITVDLIGTYTAQNDLNRPSLSGEIRQWTLRISNVGTAAASNMTMKTNLPWVYVIEKEDGNITDDKQAISNCVGPTGTLMYIPLYGAGLDKSGVIRPGESVDVNIEIRTQGSHKQDFYMLFRYELFSDRIPNEEPRFRWLKKMFKVPVYPSLTLSATVTPAFSTKDHILSVEIVNGRTDSCNQLDLRLAALSLASHRYRLERLPDLREKATNINSIAWQERITMHFRLVCNEKWNNIPALLSHRVLMEAQEVLANIGSPGLLRFLCLERAHSVFEESLLQHQMALARAGAHGEEDNHPQSIASIRRANTSDLSIPGNESTDNATGSKEHSVSIARLSPPNSALENVHLICSWSGPKESFCGIHYIHGLTVRPQSVNIGCPILVQASHPSLVSSDFESGPAKVPFKVTFRNRLIDSAVHFEVAVKDEEYNFDFTGPVCYHASLGSGEDMSIPMEAQLPSPGVYNLQRLRIKVKNGSVSDHVFPSQWLVTAQNAREIVTG
jgi:hypothetical protein